MKAGDTGGLLDARGGGSARWGRVAGAGECPPRGPPGWRPASAP